MSSRPNGQRRARRARVLAAGAGAATLVAALLGIGLQAGSEVTAAKRATTSAAVATRTSDTASSSSTLVGSSTQTVAVAAQTSSGGS